MNPPSLRRAAVFPRAIISLLTCALAAMLLAPGSRANSPAASAPHPTVRVEAAWIRWLPAGLPAAGYLTLTNTGDKTLGLMAASSPDYGEVSIHRSITRGTTEEMIPVDEIKLEPHLTLTFETLGYHLMLTKPQKSVDTSAVIPITLRFTDGSSMTVPFEVRRNSTPSPPGSGH